LTGLLKPYSWLLPLDPQQSCWRLLNDKAYCDYRCFGASIIVDLFHTPLPSAVHRRPQTLTIASERHQYTIDGDVIRYGRFSRYMLPFSRTPVSITPCRGMLTRETWCCTLAGGVISVRATLSTKLAAVPPNAFQKTNRALILAHNRWCQGLDRNGNAFFVIVVVRDNRVVEFGQGR
jgi:hypothetical protein